MIDMGVAGFRIDAAKHMYPAELDDVEIRYVSKFISEYKNIAMTRARIIICYVVYIRCIKDVIVSDVELRVCI